MLSQMHELSIKHITHYFTVQTNLTLAQEHNKLSNNNKVVKLAIQGP